MMTDCRLCCRCKTSKNVSLGIGHWDSKRKEVHLVAEISLAASAHKRWIIYDNIILKHGTSIVQYVVKGTTCCAQVSVEKECKVSQVCPGVKQKKKEKKKKT